LPDDMPVRIVGDGPLRELLVSAAAKRRHVTIEGWVPRANVPALIQAARIAIFPSECYENFPLTIAEAFACGTPVLCSRIGVHEELVEDRVTGLHFTAGDPSDLASSLRAAWEDATVLERVASGARARYDALYGVERNREQLIGIYEKAIQRNHQNLHVGA
jgi:glycosyltransferase involved in cell wall biosynthesis